MKVFELSRLVDTSVDLLAISSKLLELLSEVPRKSVTSFMLSLPVRELLLLGPPLVPFTTLTVLKELTTGPLRTLVELGAASVRVPKVELDDLEYPLSDGGSEKLNLS